MCQAYVTLSDTSALTSADIINSVTLYVYANGYKDVASSTNFVLRDQNGAAGLTHVGQVTSVSSAQWYGFTNTSVSWTKSTIDNMTIGILPLEGPINIYEIYVSIDYDTGTPIQLTSGLIQLTSGKISI